MQFDEKYVINGLIPFCERRERIRNSFQKKVTELTTQRIQTRTELPSGATENTEAKNQTETSFPQTVGRYHKQIHRQKSLKITIPNRISTNTNYTHRKKKWTETASINEERQPEQRQSLERDTNCRIRGNEYKNELQSYNPTRFGSKKTITVAVFGSRGHPTAMAGKMKKSK